VTPPTVTGRVSQCTKVTPPTMTTPLKGTCHRSNTWSIPPCKVGPQAPTCLTPKFCFPGTHPAYDDSFFQHWFRESVSFGRGVCIPCPPQRNFWSGWRQNFPTLQVGVAPYSSTLRSGPSAFSALTQGTKAAAPTTKQII